MSADKQCPSTLDPRNRKTTRSESLKVDGKPPYTAVLPSHASFMLNCSVTLCLFATNANTYSFFSAFYS